ncbi:40318_t:CDS:2, partial [Gigaspora margarita]
WVLAHNAKDSTYQKRIEKQDWKIFRKKEESFEHLTACEVDEARWLKKEYSI